MKGSKLKKIAPSQKIIKKIVKFWLPVVIWAVVIFLFSARPTPRATRIFWQDFILKKSAHVFEYAVFTTLLYRALKEGGIEKKEAGISSIILAVLYGVSDEIHQFFTPGREPRVRDVVFDTIGAILAIYGIWRYLPKAPKKLRLWAERWQLT